MSGTYREEIAEVTCGTCPLRTLPDIYWQQNNRGVDPHDLALAVVSAIDHVSAYTREELAERRGHSPITEKLNDLHEDTVRLYDDQGRPSIIQEDENGVRVPWTAGQERGKHSQLQTGAGMIAAGSCLDRIGNQTCDKFRPPRARLEQEASPNIFQDMNPRAAANMLRQLAARGSDEGVRQMADRIRDALIETAQAQAWHGDTETETAGVAREAADRDPALDRTLLLTIAMQLDAPEQEG